jgi:kanamycin nucleotidyltransferase
VEDWTPPRFTTEERLRAADAVLARLRQRYGEALRTVVLEGSTAKGLDRPESDLELRAVVEGGPEHRWYPCFFRRLFVGVSVVTSARLLAEASEVTYTWPVEGDALFTGRVLHDPGDFYAHARAVARLAESRADFAGLAREAAADMYEHVYKVFTAEGDGATAAAEARQVAFWAADTVGLVHRHRYLSSRTLFAESARLPDLPPGYAAHLEGLLSLRTDPAELRRHTGALWAGLEGWLAGRGVRLDDDDLAGL